MDNKKEKEDYNQILSLETDYYLQLCIVNFHTKYVYPFV